MPFRYKLSCLSFPLHTWRRRVETKLEIPPCFFLLGGPRVRPGAGAEAADADINHPAPSPR